MALERGKGKYIGEAKDGFQEEHKKNKTQTKYGSESGSGSRNTKEKKKRKTHLEEPRQKTGYRQRIAEGCKQKTEMQNGGIKAGGFPDCVLLKYMCPL